MDKHYLDGKKKSTSGMVFPADAIIVPPFPANDFPETSTMTKLIAALDTPSLEEGLELVDKLGDSVEWFKVGSRLFCLSGPTAVAELKKRGKKVFLDLKFHDIPNTVANAVDAVVGSGADMVNVHALGGAEMMRAAVGTARKAVPSPLVIAVTVLTSMDEDALRQALGLDGPCLPAAHVERLASLAKASGMDGVVCSAWEIEAIRRVAGAEFKLIVPGIRPAGADTGDQKRVATPAMATEKGADFIVVGRPIYAAANPAKAAAAITAEIARATK